MTNIDTQETDYSVYIMARTVTFEEMTNTLSWIFSANSLKQFADRYCMLLHSDMFS